jgi:uncharacterized metal-binding protein
MYIYMYGEFHMFMVYTSMDILFCMCTIQMKNDEVMEILDFRALPVFTFACKDRHKFYY